jgi:SAM-dependent methyltransferase
VIFPCRETQAEPFATLWEAELYATYLERTAVYREEFLRRLLSLVRGGPVLEVGDGFGPTSRTLRETGARLYRALRSPWGLRPHAAGPSAPPPLRCEEGRLPFPDARFEVVYAEGQLRRWPSPQAVIGELLRVTREEGFVLLHDLRRDADPFVAEYLVREMADDESAEGRFLLRHFLASLRAAYAVDEVARLLCECGCRTFLLDGTNEMSLTVALRKGAFQST